MASVSNTLRTCWIFFLIVYYVYATNNTADSWIVSFKIGAKSCTNYKCKYLLLVHGGEFLGHIPWRLTPNEGSRGGNCEKIYSSYEIHEIHTEQWYSEIEVIVPRKDEKIYFCLRNHNGKNIPFGEKWVHQGRELFLNPESDGIHSQTGKLNASPESNEIPTSDEKETKVDLSHDTDVNYLSRANLTQEEKKDIEIRSRDKYIPLNEVNDEDKESNKENDLSKLNSNQRLDRIRDNLNKVENEFENFNRGDRKKREAKDIDVNLNDNIRVQRQIMSQMADFSSVKRVEPMIFLDGIRVEEAEKDPKIIEDGVPSVLADTKVTLRIFGQGLTPRTVIAFTHDALEYGQPCKFLLKGEYVAKEDSVTSTSALFEFWAPSPIISSKLYICAKNLKPGILPSEDEEKYLHQGTESWKVLATHNKLMPLWVALILILVCLMFSALFSGLNLGLMSLDRTELKIIANTGTEQERKYARAIMPVRDHGNYLLCSILLGNVAVNSTFTILLDELTSGLFAVIFSTLSIVLLGEITPQAICSRHGLMIGARSIMVTKAVMALTAPLAFPVSKLLDYFLGEEIGNVYNRERLKELVKVTTGVNDLDKDEVNIISGALELRKKTVSDVMTKLEDVFMLPITSILDFETMSEIIKSGYSRIPVYEGQRGNIVTVLFIKDLAFVDPDDNTPLRTLCQYYQNPCNFVFEDVTLDIMFKQFKDGHKGHMAFVHRINNEGEGDPFYETIGLVTLEDVIEEMIQAEIVDETDVFLDNRTKRRRNKPQHKLQDFAAFAERHDHRRIHISPQLTLATFQFLSTSVDAFRPDTVSETVLRRLLKQDVIQHIKVKGKTKKDASTYVFQQGKPVDYFVLILEGRVEVTVGRENLVFEAGPFTYFGVQALTQNVGLAESPTTSAMGSLQNINMDSMLRHTFVPDYSVRAVTEMYYLTVKRSLYLAAKRATLMEKGALSKGATNEQFDTEVDKGDKSLWILHTAFARPVSLGSLIENFRKGNLQPQGMEFKQLSQSGIADSPTSSDKQYIAKYLADKLARKLYLARSDSQLTNSSKYWTNKDSGRTDSQTANTSKHWRESTDLLRDNLIESKENLSRSELRSPKNRSKTSHKKESISRDGQMANTSKHWRESTDLLKDNLTESKENLSKSELRSPKNRSETSHKKESISRDGQTANTSKHWRESTDLKDDLSKSKENLSNTGLKSSKTFQKSSKDDARDSQTANSNYWTNKNTPRISESELSTSSLPEYEKDGSNIDIDSKGNNKKKAKFRTEQSLLTFHPHENASDADILQQLDNVSESIRIESDGRSDSVVSETDGETQKLILKKLAMILRLLEKKDPT